MHTRAVEKYRKLVHKAVFFLAKINGDRGYGLVGRAYTLQPGDRSLIPLGSGILYWNWVCVLFIVLSSVVSSDCPDSLLTTDFMEASHCVCV